MNSIISTLIELNNQDIAEEESEDYVKSLQVKNYNMIVGTFPNEGGANILELSYMPLFPSPRRRVEEGCSHSGTNTTVLPRPTKGRKKMNPDKNLLQYERYTGQIHHVVTSWYIYSGTTEAHLIARKVHYYNCEILGANDNGSTSIEDLSVEKMLKMYQAAADNMEISMDILMNLILEAGV
ncbi:hypothetical protein CHS0354_034851 [Potamilus streckersoni]|uniref:Uncharacterized protein n=1 Tax=Potamilus streckersoni TaxID=2493646 RepID=A0AAE0TK35_9BIVA|nr:hypothetical protein CHS0354_034851 [Potamilus streckersoni]